MPGGDAYFFISPKRAECRSKTPVGRSASLSATPQILALPSAVSSRVSGLSIGTVAYGRHGPLWSDSDSVTIKYPLVRDLAEDADPVAVARQALKIAGQSVDRRLANEAEEAGCHMVHLTS